MNTRFKLTQALIAAAALGVSTIAIAKTTEPQPTVTISVTDIDAQQGFIMAALYAEGEWDGAPVAVAREPVSDDTVAVVLNAPGLGRYAIRLYHDVDSDGELDANMFGIPTEPYGFSNNAAGQFGPPGFSAAAFEVGAEGVAQSIALQ